MTVHVLNSHAYVAFNCLSGSYFHNFPTDNIDNNNNVNTTCANCKGCTKKTDHKYTDEVLVITTTLGRSMGSSNWAY